jgi:adenylate cyclase class 2
VKKHTKYFSRICFMSTESESKFAVRDFSGVENKLCTCGTLCTPWHFEHNTVFDTPDGSLRAQGILLRIREALTNTLTLKRPLRVTGLSAHIKHLEEIESKISDTSTAQRIFEALGYRPILCYEKFRSIWQVTACSVFLDQLPFGKFIEIEGNESTICETAQQLGLNPKSASAQNYHQLFKHYLTAHDLPMEESFCFSENKRLAFTKKLGIPEKA